MAASDTEGTRTTAPLPGGGKANAPAAATAAVAAPVPEITSPRPAPLTPPAATPPVASSAKSAEGEATPTFSPDGRWLATTSAAGLQLWKVGTWERGLSLPDGAAVFSPDGSLLGVWSHFVITFLDPEVKPPHYRVPRGRSGVGADSALQTLLQDLERVRRAREAYGELAAPVPQPQQFLF